MSKSTIEWVEAVARSRGMIPWSWNPIQSRQKGPMGLGFACTKCSPGCKHCWAEAFNMRFGNRLSFAGQKPEFELSEKALQEPFHWREPRVVFVQPMGDLFHPNVTDDQLIEVLFPAHVLPNDIWIFVTKRVERVLELSKAGKLPTRAWVIPTICTQAEADRVIPQLLQIECALRGVSIEPLLERVTIDWTGGFGPDVAFQRPSLLEWIIAGVESLGSRPGRDPGLDAIRRLRDQCLKAAVPFFLKQASIGGRLVRMPELDGHVWSQVPGEMG